MTLTNAQLAELLAVAAGEAKGNAQKAFRRASRRAFVWEVEARDLFAEGVSLTQLPGVGPFLGAQIKQWLEDPPAVAETDPTREGFLTLTECLDLLSRDPGWRQRLKGDLQMHTTFSDGHASASEMADAAIALGHRFIAITDHSKGLKIAGGIDEQELARQGTLIDELNEELTRRGTQLQVLKSIELNLSPSGEGDMDPEALDRLDLVLGSFHSSLRKKEDQTDRYLAALSQPYVHILGHPRGRIYNFRIGLTADWDRVFEHAASLDKAVEVDCFPDRQDLDVALLQRAAASGVRVSIGTDAHYIDQLSFIEFGLAATLKAGIQPDRIVNFMAKDQIVAWVARLRGQ